MAWNPILMLVILLLMAFIIGYMASFSRYGNRMLSLLRDIRLSERINEADFIYYKDKYIFKTYKGKLNEAKLLFMEDFNRIKSLFKRKKKEDLIDEKNVY